ncbi:MAG: Ig-like domain-containing protein [Gemmatimonadota bacterium]
MSVAVRARHLLGACALGALALAGCGDADGPLGTPHEGGTVQIPLAPGFHAAAANYTGAPINRVRITARLMPGGSVVGTAVVDVDPDQSQWSVPFEVTLPPGGAATLEVLVELVNVVDGVETTQWSGEITLTGVQPGEPQQVQSPELVPGPPENLNITGVSITGPAGPVVEGTELDLAAQVQGGPADPTVVWSALTPETATVDQDGHVVTLRPGTARFGVLAGTRTDTHEIEVTQRAASVAITPGSQTLAALGAEATFSAQVLDPRGDPVAGDPALTWSVVEGSAVSMQGPGVFRAEQNGQATVRVALDGAADVAATATVTVEQQVAVVVVTPGSTTVDGLGSTAQFSAEAQDANGNAVGDPTFTWSVDNGDVASIDAAGQATANGVGTTGLSAAADGVSGSASLTVTQHVVSVEMSTTRLEIDALGVDEQLTATARDRNGNPMDVELTWMSALPTVATVDQSGLVTSQANGQAIVFVTAPGNARGDVLVQIEQVVTDVVVDPAEHLYEALGATQLFTATPVDRNGTEVQGRIVTWSTSDGGVVAVSDHGDNTATGTAVSNGEARIDATLGSIEGAAAVKVDAEVGPHLTGPVLLYFADDMSAGEALRSNMAETGLIPTSEIFLASMTSPPMPLANLVEFGCVIAWTNSSPPGPVAVGDRLKEFVDAGGRVVLAIYGYSLPTDPWELQGGIMSPGYSPFVPQNIRLFQFPRELDFSTAATGHPVLSGVTEFSYEGNSNYSQVTLDTGATLVGSDNFGVPLIGVNAAGTVTGINLYPGDVFHKSPGVYRVFANACGVPSTTPGQPSSTVMPSAATILILENVRAGVEVMDQAPRASRFQRPTLPIRR